MESPWQRDDEGLRSLALTVGVERQPALKADLVSAKLGVNSSGVSWLSPRTRSRGPACTGTMPDGSPSWRGERRPPRTAVGARLRRKGLS